MVKLFSRIGLIGDVHAQDARLLAALSFLREQNVEQILCVGDLVDGFGDGERCCQLLREFDVATVRGNHDRWVLDDQMRELPGSVLRSSLGTQTVDYLRALPRTLTFATTRGPLLLCHGVGQNDMNKLTPDDYGYALECNDELQALMVGGVYRFGVGGHTHQPMVRRFGPLTWINPGALVDHHEPCFALADFERERVEFYEFAGAGVVVLADMEVL